MIADTVKQAYRRFWWSLVVRGLFAIALAVLILAKPFDSIAAFALVIAIWALFSGITEIVHAFDIRPVFSSWWLLLLGGAISVVFGVAALMYYPALSIAFAVTWASYWLAMSGVVGIAGAFMQKRAGMPWGLALVWGLVCLAASVMAWMSPPATLGAIMGLIAGFALLSGIALLIAAFRLQSIVRSVQQSLHQPSPA